MSSNKKGCQKMALPGSSSRSRNTRARRQRRNLTSEGDINRSGLADGGIVKSMLRRQAMGGRNLGRGGVKFGGGLGAREILSARGEFRKRIGRQFEGVPDMIIETKNALASGNHAELFSAVLAIKTKLVDGTSAPFDMCVTSNQSRHSGGGGGVPGGGAGLDGGGGGGGGGAVGDGHVHGHRHGDDDDENGPHHQNGYRQVRRLDRDVFVALGGPEYLVKVLRRPGSPADARSFPAAIVARDTPVWNVTLVVLRELCFTDQDLSERLGCSELIMYLLTMLGHPGVFDLAVGLVEEILAIKSSTYFLGEVPQLHSLVGNMTSQQLAHFSRVLALLVFEPEYRQLMESAHVLRSMELLQLRRDRVVRADSVIEKNQALILSAPDLLPRLVELLRFMNYNRPLAVFDGQAVELQDAQVAQVRISLLGEDGRRNETGVQQPVMTDWGYLAQLRAAANVPPPPPTPPRISTDYESPMIDMSIHGDVVGGPFVDVDHEPSREPGRIVNFFRSIFRRQPQQHHPDHASASGGAVGNGTAADEAEAVAAAEVRGALRHRARLREARAAIEGDAPGGGGGSGGGGDSVHVPAAPAAIDGVPAAADGVDGLASLAIRDFLQFLQPVLVGGPDLTGSMATLEHALSWPAGGGVMSDMGGASGVVARRRLRNPSADEAQEELQFNGLLLAPYQVEVLFVLCTLLGARRKGEAHDALAQLGLVDVLHSMFDRLSWDVPLRQEGPHGAQCDCNPESALRVQYLRLVHNFLDRDSNDNPLKRLLLSPHERYLFASGRFMANPNGSGNVVFVTSGKPVSQAQAPCGWRGRASPFTSGIRTAQETKWNDTRGLLSKIVDVLMQEPMDSLYRFWLASCVEAFLRGGSTQEQLFIAGGGLLPHLVKEITSDGIWCAGSLQTAFDLLGELCKGNPEVLGMLESLMTQKQLRRFVEVMVGNLVDSNVFMRSLVLSVEPSAFRQDIRDLGPRSSPVRPEVSQQEEKRENGTNAAGAGGVGGGAAVRDDVEEPCYLGHTWYDVQPQEVEDVVAEEEGEEKGGVLERGVTKEAIGEWFAREGRPRAPDGAANGGGGVGCEGGGGGCSLARQGVGEVEERAVGAEHCCDAGEVRVAAVTPCAGKAEGRVVPAERALTWAAEGNGARGGFTRLQSFLQHNIALLVRDLMGVVTLETINHENICCLNTAVLILIFADQRGQLAELLEEVRQLPPGKGTSDDGKIFELHEGDDEALPWAEHKEGGVARQEGRGYPFDGSGDHRAATGGNGVGMDDLPSPQDGAAVLRGFRRLLWFWGEYYMRGGRDRLSLEFSTHVKFWAWKRVIRLLCADDGSPTSLVDEPIHLPHSPYDAVSSQHQ